MSEAKQDAVASTKTTVQPRSLVKKLAEVMATVGYVKKTGRNTFQNYDYATEADIIASVRQEMANRSLILIPDVIKTDWEVGPKQKVCTLTVEYTLEDGDSGEKRVFHVIGQGQDNQDKATYKAMTGATKYALMKLFLIPTGDDPEQDDDGTRPLPRQDAPKPEGKKTAPAQASAKTAKATPLPPEPSGRETEEAALKARRLRLWRNAEKAGATQESFRTWAAQCLGVAKPSTEITAEDCVKLEAELASGFKLVEEPPDSPKEEEMRLSPLVRLTSLAAKRGISLQAVLTKASALCGGKTGGWTHADVDKVEASLWAIPKRSDTK